MSKPQGLWALFVVLLVASAATALIAVLGIAAIVSGNAGEGTSRVDSIIGDGVFLAATALLAWGARRVEHRARTGGTPAAAAPLTMPRDANEMLSQLESEGRIRKSDLPSGFSLPPPSRRHVWGRRRRTPHSHLFYACVFGGMSLFMIFVTVATYHSAQRSSFVQHHGIAAPATVAQVEKEVHNTRSGSYTTVNVVVQLMTPVDGHSRYTIDTEASTPPAPVGGGVTILIDRNDPSYAELPGEPRDTITAVIVCVVIMALFAAVAVAEEVLHLRHRGAVSPPG
ncbi:MAG TPA: hypothetical protein VHT30_11510 [Acidimicrobiales bacterium]|jgi:hypothetical protein|nr:hypothetical protein [Acidimicrobiales bacterium]